MNSVERFIGGLTTGVLSASNMLINKCLRLWKRLESWLPASQKRTETKSTMPLEMCSSLSLSSLPSSTSIQSHPSIKFMTSSANAPDKPSTVSSSRTNQTKTDMATKEQNEILVLRSKIAYVSGLLQGLSMKESLNERMKETLIRAIDRINE